MLTKRRAVLFLMTAVSLAGLFAFYPRTSHATTAYDFISFQGKVVNADGTNVVNGTYPFNFILWDDPTAGTNRWQELGKNVTVTNGVFQTNLGSATALPDFNAYPNLYLAIQFNNDAQGYMTPRVQLTGVPYAINSNKLGGLTSASFGQISAANAWTGANSIKVVSPTAFQVQNSSSNGILTVDTSGGQVLLGALGGSGVNGTLVFNSATAGNFTVTLVASSSQSASYSLTLPTAAPTGSGQCLQTSGSASQLAFAGCGSGSGVTAVGAFSGSSQTNGASIAGSTITFGPADMTNPGMVSTSSQTFTGDKAFKSTTNSTTAFQIQNAAGSTVFNVDTTDTQLITTNPGFEASPLTGWSGLTAGTVARDTTQAYIGFASGKVTAGTSAGGGISYLATLSTGTQYTLSFYAKLDSASAALTTLQAGYNGNSSEVDCTWQGTTSTNATALSTGWQRYVCTFTTPGSTSGSPYIYIQHNDTTSEVFYVDAVQLETGAVVSPYGAGTISLNATLSSPTIFMNQSDSSTEFQVKTAGSLNLLTIDSSSKNQNNLVTNPSAEVGLTASGTWSARGSSTVTQSQDFAYNGSNSVKVVTTAAASDGVKYTTGSSFLASGTTYTLLAYVKTSSTLATNTFEIGHADDGTTPTDVSCLTAQPLTQGWTKFTCTWTSGTITGTPYIYFKQTDAPTGGRTFYVDAVLLQTDANADSNYRDGKINFGNSVFNNPIVFQNAQNSSTALQIQNASGTQIFNVDTTDTNLISNPGFETNIAGWTASGTGSIRRDTSQTYLGIASLKVISQAAANSGAQFNLNPIVTKTSTTYTISFYGRFDSGSTTPTLNIRYSPDGTATSDCSVTAINLTAMVSTGWTRYYCAVSSATAPTTSGFIRIMQTDATAHTYYVDAVQMEETTVANMTAYGAGTISWNGIVSTPAIFKSTSNATTAFLVQNVAGTNLLAVDTLNSAVTLGNTALSSGTQTINLGNANTSGGTTNVYIGSGTSATGGVTTITSKGLLTLTGYGGATITGNTGVLTLGNTGLTGLGLNLLGPTYTTAERGVAIGTSDANITMFDPDISTASGAETAGNCTTAINAGGIYYSASTASSNTTTQELRGCINGVFKDIVTADQLGVMLLGVVEDSGAANQGDIGGISGVANGPCKVSWASTTSVSVAPCSAYSAGRKVVITAATAVSSLSGASMYYHICLNGTNGAPTATAGNASETAAVPAFSATAPILCLATVKTGGSSTITNIYDTRIFVSSRKQFSTINAAVAPGMIVTLDGTNANRVVTTTSAAAANVRGVVAVGTTAASTTTINTIIATSGPAFVEGTGTITVGQTAQTSTTAGYAQSAASAAAYKDLGLVIWPGVTTGCTASTDCQYSMLIDVNPH